MAGFRVVRLPDKTDKIMKTKQLANVLIKILGLSLLIGSINRIIFALSFNTAREIRSAPQGFNWFHAISEAIVPVIAIFLIVKSRALAEFLFKNEDE
jgi:hypothetical protein